MDELKIVISSLCKSPFLSEWILKLKDNDVLFSPRKNIKPCVLLDDKNVKSSYWEGLLLLKAYCSKGIDNRDVDEFIVSIINRSISIYRQDKTENPYKKLNSSQAILNDLLDIILSKSSYVDGVDFEGFVNVYLESATAWPFSLVHDMYLAKNVLEEADQKKVFAAYKAICQHKSDKVDYENYLFVKELVLKNPQDYYNLAKEHLLSECLSKVYYDMGAFYEYDLSRPYSEDKYYFKWIKESSFGLDGNMLTSEIASFIKSENRLLNKVGLCLMNLNFGRMSRLFFENLGLFFSKKSFYPDLRCILNRRNTQIFLPENFELLSKTLKDATFGLDDKTTINKLKNHLSKIYSANGIKTSFYDEKRSDYELVYNFDKIIYSVPAHEDEDIKTIRSTIWEKDIEEAIEVFSKYSKVSHYYEHIVFEAYVEYLLHFYPNNFCEYLTRFGASFSSHLLFYFSDDKTFSEKKLINVINTVIKTIAEDDSFRECLPTLLHSLDKLSNSADIKTLKELASSIDYKWFNVVEFSEDETKNVILTCINEDLHTYLELRGYVAQMTSDGDFLKNPIEYQIKNNDCSKLKSIIAFVFPRLLSVDEKYALSLTDYVFNNIKGEMNLSYPLLAISSGVNERLLDIVGERDDLVHFLKENVESQEDRIALSSLFQKLLKPFIFNKKHSELVKIQFYTEQFDVILMCIRNLNYWFESKAIGNAQLSQCRLFLDLLYFAVKGCKNEIPEVDQLIREVANMIVVSNDFYPKAWQVLLLLFKHFKRFFSDELVELIKRFKGQKIEEITQLLTMYFSSYEPYLYEDTMAKVFNLIAKEDSYAKEAKKWKVSLLNKDSSLRSVLV